MRPHPASAPGPGTTDSTDADDPRSLLSRVLDGEGTQGCAESACRQWRDDPGMRATWHEYHLIGDALRSSDLRLDPGHDRAFLERLSRRLADEPSIVAPRIDVPVRSASAWRARRWMAPAAVAAGFVVVAGVLVVVRSTSIDTGAPVLSQSQPVRSPAGAVLVSTPATAAVVEPSAELAVPDARLIRDARIDQYLQAHRDMRINPVAAAPGGGPRPVDAGLPSR